MGTVTSTISGSSVSDIGLSRGILMTWITGVPCVSALEVIATHPAEA